MTGKGIAQVWTFESGSSSNTYETLEYDDGTTSCNCRGWTIKRGDKPRSCKHTRMVDQGIANNSCIAHKDYRGSQTGSKKAAPKKTAPAPKKKAKATQSGGRQILWQ